MVITLNDEFINGLYQKKQCLKITAQQRSAAQSFSDNVLQANYCSVIVPEQVMMLAPFENGIPQNLAESFPFT